MEVHVVAVRNLKEKKIDAFTNNHNFDTFFHFHCSQLLKPKLVRRNYESACLVRHHRCIFLFCNFFNFCNGNFTQVFPSKELLVFQSRGGTVHSLLS